MSIPTERQLNALLGAGIFNLTLRRGSDPPRSQFIRDLADDDTVIKALQNMLDSCEGLAPTSENRYPRDPVVGDVKYCVDRFASQPSDIKATIQAFVSALLESSALQSLKGSRVRVDAYLRRRFKLPGLTGGGGEKKVRFSEPKPMQGGQSYTGQPTPSNTGIRRELQSKGSVEATYSNSLWGNDENKNENIQPITPMATETVTGTGTTSWLETARKKLAEANRGRPITVEKAEQIFDGIGYLNEKTNTFYETFEDFLESLPSWEEFISIRKWDYDSVNHLLRQSGFHGRVDPKMFSFPLPKDASVIEIVRWVKQIWTRGMNLFLIAKDVSSAIANPGYHATRFVASETARSAGLPVGTANVLTDPLSYIQEEGMSSVEQGMKRAFETVIQNSETSQEGKGESTTEGRLALNSTTTASTGVGAGFTGGGGAPAQSSTGNSGGAGSKVIPSNPPPPAPPVPELTSDQKRDFFNQFIRNLAETVMTHAASEEDRKKVTDIRKRIIYAEWDRHQNWNAKERVYQFAKKFSGKTLNFDDAAAIFGRYAQRVGEREGFFVSDRADTRFSKQQPPNGQDPIINYANYMASKYIEAAQQRGLPAEEYRAVANQILSTFNSKYESMSAAQKYALNYRGREMMNRIRAGNYPNLEQDWSNDFAMLATKLGVPWKKLPVQSTRSESVTAPHDDPAFQNIGGDPAPRYISLEATTPQIGAEDKFNGQVHGVIHGVNGDVSIADHGDDQNRPAQPVHAKPKPVSASERARERNSLRGQAADQGGLREQSRGLLRNTGKRRLMGVGTEMDVDNLKAELGSLVNTNSDNFMVVTMGALLGAVVENAPTLVAQAGGSVQRLYSMIGSLVNSVESRYGIQLPEGIADDLVNAAQHPEQQNYQNVRAAIQQELAQPDNGQTNINPSQVQENPSLVPQFLHNLWNTVVQPFFPPSGPAGPAGGGDGAAGPGMDQTNVAGGGGGGPPGGPGAPGAGTGFTANGPGGTGMQGPNMGFGVPAGGTGFSNGSGPGGGTQGPNIGQRQQTGTPFEWDPTKGSGNPLQGGVESPAQNRVGIYNTPTGERRFSDFIDVEEVKEPLLRPSFLEGGANIVNSINKDKKLQEINRLMWQSFNNYSWDSNQEQDNPLYALQLIEDGSRFSSPLEGEDKLPEQAQQAWAERNYQNYEAPYAVSQQVKRDADVEDFMIDIHPGPQSIRSGRSTDAEFHDVFLPSLAVIPNSSPWKQFSATEGTQIPDSYLYHPSRITAYDWPRYDRTNRFIMTTSR